MRKQLERTPALTPVSSVLGLDGFEDLLEPVENNQVKWDFNLSRLPYFVPGQTRADRFRSLHLIERIEKGGKVMEVEWRVIHHPELGLPGGFDRDVWIGILQLGHEQGYPEKIDLGSCYSFLKRLSKPSNGQYVKMLRESIERLATTGCVTKGAFNCPASGGYLHLGEAFHLIRRWAFKGEPKTGGGVHETNFVVLDPIIKENLDSFYVSLLRVDFLRGLKGEITKLLYPLLCYRFWRASQEGRAGWRVHWSELVGYIALKGIDSLKRAKDTLKPALKELISKGYVDEGSEWKGEHFHFLPGLECVKEHQQKVLSRDAQAERRRFPWKKSQQTKGMQSIQQPAPQVWHSSQNDPDPKGTEIGYQIFRLKCGKTVQNERLDKLGITVQEVYDAMELEKSKQ